MEKVYYISKEDKIYDVSKLNDGDKVKEYIVNNFTEITYDEFMREYTTDFNTNDYYPEVRNNFKELEYRANIMDNKVELEVNSNEYNEILGRIQ